MEIELIECKPYAARLTERDCRLRQERARTLYNKKPRRPNESELLGGMKACLHDCERVRRDDVRMQR